MADDTQDPAASPAIDTAAAGPYQLPRAQLRWDADGAPVSAAFDDVYFSRANGLAETEHVFLHSNRLAERWRALNPQRPGVFVIGETGFGTGLNFLCAWRLWRALAPPGWRLHFVSAEKFPLTHAELERALAQWPQLAALVAPLLALYPPAVPGYHLLALPDGTRLQLLFGAADAMFEQLPDSAATELPAGVQVDAWFLDGFAPAKNPEMWSDALFRSIGRLSAAGTTFATFTCAGFVRRGLRAAGFRVEKTAGFGTKREMARGEWLPLPAADSRLDNDADSAVAAAADNKAVHDIATAGCDTAAHPAAPDRTRQPAPARAIDYWALPPAALPRQRVVVIGGGLAGTSTARALAERGWPVTLLEAGATLAAGASGNSQGVLYTKLSAQANPLSRFALASYLHALAHYRRDAAAGEFCGVLQLIDDTEQWRQLGAAFAGHEEWVQAVDAQRAAALAHCTVTQPALWFPRAGWLAPAQLCAEYVNHPLIEVRLGCAVHALQRDGADWLLQSTNGELRAGCVVLATAAATPALIAAAQLPLRAIRGQITAVPAQWLRQRPACVVCHEGYLAPAPAGGIHIGATFDHRDDDTGVRTADHRRNLASLAQALPDVLMAEPAALPAASFDGRTGFRCATPDYLPMVGALADAALLRERCAALAKNARNRIAAPAAWLPGLYVNVGHGSRGLTSTPLCAELLAALIAGGPRPLPRELVQALSPARFALRDLIRGR